jgi:hypothetical protein
LILYPYDFFARALYYNPAIRKIAEPLGVSPVLGGAIANSAGDFDHRRGEKPGLRALTHVIASAAPLKEITPLGARSADAEERGSLRFTFGSGHVLDVSADSYGEYRIAFDLILTWQPSLS